MRYRIQWQNFYKTTLTTQIPAGTATDTTEKYFQVAEAPTANSGWLIVDFINENKREIIFYHRREWNALYYYDYNRQRPSIQHEVGAIVQMNDVAEFINWLSKNIDDFGYVQQLEKPGLRIKVYWWKVKVNNQDVDINDTILTLSDDATNYIVFDYTDNSIKALTNLSWFTGVVLAEVKTSWWDIEKITDVRQEKLPIIIDWITLHYSNWKLEIPEWWVTNRELANDSVSTDKIQDAAVTENKIANSAVTTNKIADASVTNSKLADNSVSTSKIQDSAITNNKISDGAVTNEKITGPIDWNKISKVGSSINDLEDVNVTEKSDLQALVYDASTGKWVASDEITTDRFVWLVDTPSGYPTDWKRYVPITKSDWTGIEFDRNIDVDSIKFPNNIVRENEDWDVEFSNNIVVKNKIIFNDWTSLDTASSFILWYGSDWDLIITSWTTNLNLNKLYQFSSISIANWATLSTADNYGTMIIRCRWSVVIDWIIDLNGVIRNTSNLSILWTIVLLGWKWGNGWDTSWAKWWKWGYITWNWWWWAWWQCNWYTWWNWWDWDLKQCIKWTWAYISWNSTRAKWWNGWCLWENWENWDWNEWAYSWDEWAKWNDGKWWGGWGGGAFIKWDTDTWAWWGWWWGGGKWWWALLLYCLNISWNWIIECNWWQWWKWWQWWWANSVVAENWAWWGWWWGWIVGIWFKWQNKFSWTIQCLWWSWIGWWEDWENWEYLIVKI